MDAPTKRPTHQYFFMLQKKIIRIADTDVVVLAISVVEEIKVEELWVAFGTGKHFRYIAAHAIASSLGAELIVIRSHSGAGKEN